MNKSQLNASRGKAMEFDMNFYDKMDKHFYNTGFSLTDIQKEQFKIYTDMILSWNEKINLTGITDIDEMILKHYLDSILVLKFLDFKENSKVIDVGSGAGFPSVPLKILRPDLSFTLLDSLNKRLKFLDEVISSLSFKNVFTLHMRAEDAGQHKDYREQFDYSIARAVAPLNVLMEYCVPFNKTGGNFIAMKGPEAENEIKQCDNATKKLGVTQTSFHKTILPGTDNIRSILVFEKINSTPSSYPRKAGKPSKDPL